MSSTWTSRPLKFQRRSSAMSKPQNVSCPDCGGEMVSRLNRAKNQRFWGCKKYPECKGTRDTDGESKSERRWPGHVRGEYEE
jgi:ssDNA-binding Zn-finger/Zn-ribbon topoisomerase 1